MVGRFVEERLEGIGRRGWVGFFSVGVWNLEIILSVMRNYGGF